MTDQSWQVWRWRNRANMSRDDSCPSLPSTISQGSLLSLPPGESLRLVVCRKSVSPLKLYQSINSPSSSLLIPIFHQCLFQLSPLSTSCLPQTQSEGQHFHPAPRYACPVIIIYCHFCCLAEVQCCGSGCAVR